MKSRVAGLELRVCGKEVSRVSLELRACCKEPSRISVRVVNLNASEKTEEGADADPQQKVTRERERVPY